MTEFDVPVGAPTLQAEAEVVHSIQILSWQGVVSQLPEVLGPQILPSVTRHRVIAFGGRREGWRWIHEGKQNKLIRGTLQVFGASGYLSGYHWLIWAYANLICWERYWDMVERSWTTTKWALQWDCYINYYFWGQKSILARKQWRHKNNLDSRFTHCLFFQSFSTASLYQRMDFAQWSKSLHGYSVCSHLLMWRLKTMRCCCKSPKN